MGLMGRYWLIGLLCLAGVFNGVAAAASAPAVQAPCEMASGHDTGHSPCGDCGDSSAACAQQCAVLCAGVLVARPGFSVSPNAAAQRVAIDAASLFASHAGPPGLEPPR